MLQTNVIQKMQILQFCQEEWSPIVECALYVYVLVGCPKISQGPGINSFRPPGVFWGTIDWKYIKN
jgi:hypothetical protein